MNDMIYYEKYNKYKLKYLHSKQNAGSYMTNPFQQLFSNDEKLLSRIRTGDGKIKYLNVKGQSNLFNKSEMYDFSVFVNFLLPYIMDYFYKNKQIDKLNVIDSLETIGAGTFGVTLAYEKILIKIIKINKHTTSEINNSLALFFNNNGVAYPNIAEQINKVYGYFTANKTLYTNLYVKNDNNKNLNDRSLFTNLNLNKNFYNDVHETIKNIEGYDPIKYLLMNGSICVLFMDKADVSLSTFIKEKSFNNDLVISFLKDMKKGLQYIHETRLYIHNDIKLDNIVVKKLNNNTNLFQIIDFGLLQKIENLEIIKKRSGGTPLFFSCPIYKNYTSVIYDWNCVFICLLQLLNITYDFDEKYEDITYIENIYYCDRNISAIYKQIYKKLNTKIGNNILELIHLFLYAIHLNPNGSVKNFVFGDVINSNTSFIKQIYQIIDKL